MALNYVQVTGTFEDGAGSPLNGTAIFTPSATVHAAGIPVVSASSPITAQIVNGTLKSASGGTLQLLATDNPGVAIDGMTGFWYWTVVVNAGAGPESWSFFLPSSPSPVDLYSLANTAAGGGTVTSVAVESANGLAGTVASPTTTPQITLETTVTGMVKGNGTALQQAVAGTDYLSPAGGQLAGPLIPKVAALTDAATITVDASAANVFTVTLGGNRTMASPTNPTAGQTITFHLTQDSTGSRTVTWSSAYDFGTTGAPTLTTTAAKVDIVAFTYDAGLSKWCCLGSGLGF